jgi:hypothetical protein
MPPPSSLLNEQLLAVRGRVDVAVCANWSCHEAHVVDDLSGDESSMACAGGEPGIELPIWAVQ